MSQSGGVSLPTNRIVFSLNHNINSIHLEKCENEIIEFLLLAESDQQLLAQLRVEERLLLLELQPLFTSFGDHGVADGRNIVTDVVDTSLLCVTMQSAG